MTFEESVYKRTGHSCRYWEGQGKVGAGFVMLLKEIWSDACEEVTKGIESAHQDEKAPKGKGERK